MFLSMKNEEKRLRLYIKGKMNTIVKIDLIVTIIDLYRTKYIIQDVD